MSEALKLGVLALAVLIFFQTRQANALSPESRNLIVKATNFGDEGNREVSDRYARFLARVQRCEITGPGQRVLLTGFGLFSGVPYNISGAFIENFANPAIWPAELNTETQPPKINQSVPLAPGDLDDAAGGVKVMNRRLRINNRDYNVCLLVLDVLWDFAGAVVTAEMERFQPHLVLMSGRGDFGVILEGGAKNIATSLPGFKSNGDADELNTPISKTIDIAISGERTVPMSWNNQELAKRISSSVQALGYSVSAPPQWRPSNYYICNNISFIALSAAAGYRFKLAGDLIDVHPVVASKPQIGFMHLPADTPLSRATLPTWVRIYASLIDQALTPTP